MKNMISVSVTAILLAAGLAACDTSDPAPAPTTATPTSIVSPSTTPATVAPESETTIEPATSTEPAGTVYSDTYRVVDTGQTTFYDNRNTVDTPTGAFSTQDAAYDGNQQSYTDNGDGTVTDDVTGLMWTQTPLTNVTFDEAAAASETSTVGGYDDWRLPTIKELYSLILFTGIDPSGCDETGRGCDSAVPFIDTDYFDFVYGDESTGERMIDAQYVSNTVYAGEGIGPMVFGVNFADGRIKGYGLTVRGQDKTFEALFVRGATTYGINEFVDNGDGTVTDLATGLTWTQSDSGTALEWEEALSYCSTLDTAGNNGWRLPNVKELQSIVDYTRSPSATGTAAISSLFDVTEIIDEGGNSDYPYLWSSTTHVNLGGGGSAAYVSFGEALGWTQPPPGGGYTLLDVHGAGAQRSDPKLGDAGDYPYGHGPQGDVIRITNYALCVSG